MTNDVYARTLAHREGTGSAFTAKYGVTRLVWFESHSDVDVALAREKSIKRWRRAWKLELIERSNPEWDDLFEQMA